MPPVSASPRAPRVRDRRNRFARVAVSALAVVSAGLSFEVAVSPVPAAASTRSARASRAAARRAARAARAARRAELRTLAATDPFAALRACEAQGDYGANTGNGYYGAYQFNRATWAGLGQSGLPSEAPPEVQDAAAAALQAVRGWQPWPACSRQLGLR